MRVERGRILLHEHLVQTPDGPVFLTPIERQLLQYLAERPHQVVPLEEILQAVWGYARTSRSQAVHVAIRRLRKKLELDPSQPRHLKTVAGAGWVFEPLASELAQGLLGRDAERQRLEEALGAAHRVCLTGPAGIGKTALARALGRGPFVELGAASGMDDVLAAIARALRCEVEQLPDRLAANPAVLVLDQAEHLAPELAQWLDRAPASLRCLVTSRLPLRGARRLALGPLPVEAAVELFQRRSLELGRDTTGPADQPRVRELVQFLDGNPLAIELAAARSPLLSPEVLLAELRRNPLPALQEGERSMQATLQWSWAQLSPELRRDLCSLSAFVGSFELAAAAAVLQDGARVGQVLGQLMDHGLLQAQGDRFALFRLVRAFVQRVASPEDLREARARHAAWFARLGSPELAGELSGPASPEGLQGAVPELRQAVSSALERGDLEGLSRLCFAWAEASRAVGDAGALIGTLQRALAGAEAAPDCQARLHMALALAQARSAAAPEALAHLRQAGALAADPSLLALIDTYLAPLLAQQGELEEASLAAERAVSHARASGRLGLQIGALNGGALVADVRGEPARALALLTEACRALEDAGGHRATRASLDANRASFLDRLGRQAEALAVWQSTLPDLDELNAAAAALVRNNLAHTLHETGQPEQAAQMARFAVQLHRSQGDRRHQIAPLLLLGRLAREAGDAQEARQHLGAALTLARDCERPDKIARLLEELASLELEQGREALAAPLLEEARSLRRALQEVRAIVRPPEEP
jgi:DNA-binding winged helix-turn-helix (wHTH) protein/tetratricopeptide (TPR) repeat protein